MNTAIYTRVSTPGQKNTSSLPEQQRLCREHAASLGWEVSEPHVYREVAGGEDLNRPQMERLWLAIEQHTVDAVCIDVLDRLSRDEGDVGAFYHHCDRYGVRLEVASENLDESEHGHTLRSINAIVSRIERAEIKRRTQRGRRARVASGKMFTGAYPLYGYAWADPEKGQRSRYVVDPETAPIVQRIFADVAAGVPLRRLCAQLEAEGVPTPGHFLVSRGQWSGRRPCSRLWRRAAIQRILATPAYAGQHSANRWRKTLETVRTPAGTLVKVHRQAQRAMDDPERIALPATCPALVSAELVAQVQTRLAADKAESAGRNPDPLATIWRGMATRGHCGQRITTAASRADFGRRYYCRQRQADADGNPIKTCTHSMLAHKLDPLSWADVLDWLRDPANVTRLLADWDAERSNGHNSTASRLAAADAHSATLRTRMTNLAETIATTNEVESRGVLQAKLDDTARQLREANAKRERLVREAADAASAADQARDVRRWVEVTAAEAASFTREEQVRTLKALGAELTLWRADHVNADGKPQRYAITLRFTGFGGQSVTLPYPDSENL